MITSCGLDGVFVDGETFTSEEVRRFLEASTSITGVGDLLVNLSFREHYHPSNSNHFPDVTHPLARWTMSNPHSWQAAWPGGQSLARYISENPSVVAGKTVLDFGSGGGIAAITAKKNGAARAIANDIDPLAIVAAEINAELNDVRIAVEGRDLLRLDIDPSWEVVLVGDALYTTELSTDVEKWIKRLVDAGVDVLIGDPGRSTISSQMYGSRMRVQATYRMTFHTRRATGGTCVDECHVWRWSDAECACPS